MIIQDAIYCAWDCKNSINAIIILINILVTFSLFIFGLTIFKKSKKILNEGMSKFYYLILGWALTFILKDAYSISVFFSSYVDHVEDPNWETIEENQTTITKFSVGYFFLDTIPAFILQSLLYQIPYHSIRQVHRIIKKFGDSLSSNQTHIEKAIAVYRLLRFIIMVPLVMLIIFYWVDLGIYYYENTTLFIIFLICIDCLVCNGALFYAFNHIEEKYSSMRLDKAYKKSLKLQYFLLFMSALCRFGIQLTFYIIQPIQQRITDESKYACIQPWSDDVQYTIGYVLLGTYIMHFFPVLIIERMYKPQSLS